MTHHSTPRRLARGTTLLSVGALALASACKLDVVTPTVVPPEATQGAGALSTLLAGAVGDFTVAYGGFNDGNAGEGIALQSGLFTDEFISADYFATHREVDLRNLTPANASNGAVTLHLMQALQSANRTADAYAALPAQTATSGHARALNMAGTILTILAEDYCSGIPVSSVDATGRPVYGPSKSTAELLAMANAKFDEAIAVATAAKSSTQLNYARVGKARALVDAGQFSAAASVASAVPTAFTFGTEQGTVDDRTKNGIYALTFVSSRFTTANVEGRNGEPFVTARDARVPTEALGTSSFDGSTALFAPANFGSYDAPIPIASGIEARLIEAEAQLRGGNYPAALTTLNDLRLQFGLDPLDPAATPAAQVNQLFNERAFWLFGTAHRLGDLRRLVTQYARPANTVFPTGEYFKGGAYGNQVNLLVPQAEEQDNPNFKRSACDPTKA